jgi:uncharacterized membrane protein YdbT with pleckstrin-like domain
MIFVIQTIKYKKSFFNRFIRIVDLRIKIAAFFIQNNKTFKILFYSTFCIKTKKIYSQI